MAEISAEYVEIIAELLEADEKVEALDVLKEHAVEIRIATAEGVQESWERISDHRLDPWTDRRVFTMMRRGREVKQITVLKRQDGKNIIIDGRRRCRALDKLGFAETDMVGAYFVVDDGSEERWIKYDILVKPVESPTSKTETSA